MSLKNMIKIFPSSYILFHLMSVINIKNRIMTDYTRELKIAELIVRQEIGELDTAEQQALSQWLEESEAPCQRFTGGF